MYKKEISSRIEELRDINIQLQKKEQVTDSLLKQSTNKKEILLKTLKQYDDELYSLDNQIEGYYNELFNELKLDKNKKILSNLNILKELLDSKAASLNKRREQVEERETELNKKISLLSTSQLELFNQIMSKIDQNDKNIDEKLTDTSNIKIEYEKMKNIYFNEISDEIKKINLNEEKKRTRPKSMDYNENKVQSTFQNQNKNTQAKIIMTRYNDKKPRHFSSTKISKTVGNNYSLPPNKKVKTTRVSHFQSKLFSKNNL